MAENHHHQMGHIPVEPMELGDNEADATIADDQLPIVDPMSASNAVDTLSMVDSAPVDIDQICSQYTGYALMQRLLFIADHCPLLKRDALVALIHYVQQHTHNVGMYQQAMSKLAPLMQQPLSDQQQRPSSGVGSDGGGGGALAASDAIADAMQQQQQHRVPVYDQNWVDQTTKRAQNKLEKLDTDLKHYKNNSIKESIRRGQDDLGEHYLDMGILPDALKCFNRARDYCTSCKHVLNMCFNVIKVSAYLSNWALVTSYVTRAENSGDLGTTGGTKDVVSQRVSANAKVRAASGLAELALKKYRPAARNFLMIAFDPLEYAELIAPRDIAIYGSLCALATYDRTELQRNVIQNTGFKQFLELAPQLNELIVLFNDSAYGACLAILDTLRDALLLDMYLAPHVHALYALIRSRGLVQYFSPYLSADMHLMASAFNTSVAQLEDELIELILRGDIRARIDSHTKTLHARDVDERSSGYERSLAVGRALEARTHAIVLRAAMQRAKISVRAPARSNGAGTHQQQQHFYPFAALATYHQQHHQPMMIVGGGNNNAAGVDFSDTPGNSGQSSPQ